MKKCPPVKLPIIDTWHDGQCYVDGDEAWNVQTLWDAAKDLPTYEVPLIGMDVSNIGVWDGAASGYLAYLAHMKLILDADMSYPIILTPEGSIADGRHRLGKAIIEGRTKVSIVRLPFMPVPDWTFDDDGNAIEEDD